MLVVKSPLKNFRLLKWDIFNPWTSWLFHWQLEPRYARAIKGEVFLEHDWSVLIGFYPKTSVFQHESTNLEFQSFVNWATQKRYPIPLINYTTNHKLLTKKMITNWLKKSNRWSILKIKLALTILRNYSAKF